MIQGQLDFLNEPDKEYAVRVCALVEEVGDPVPGSVHKSCEGCERDVWYNARQIVPPARGVTFEREVVVCIGCALLLMAQQDEPIKWIG